jgi:hypothetical protein
MLTQQELENLLEVLNPETIPEMTFDECMNKFSKSFNQKTDWFKACATLCYLIEAQVSNHHLVMLVAVKVPADCRILHPLRSVSV